MNGIPEILIFLYLASRFANGYGLLESINPTDPIGFLICLYLGWLIFLCFAMPNNKEVKDMKAEKQKEKDEFVNRCYRAATRLQWLGMAETARQLDVKFGYSNNLGLGTYGDWAKEGLDRYRRELEWSIEIENKTELIEELKKQPMTEENKIRIRNLTATIEMDREFLRGHGLDDKARPFNKVRTIFGKYDKEGRLIEGSITDELTLELIRKEENRNKLK